MVPIVVIRDYIKYNHCVFSCHEQATFYWPTLYISYILVTRWEQKQSLLFSTLISAHWLNYLDVLVYSNVRSARSSVHISSCCYDILGVRLYFSTGAFGDMRGRPCMLSLIHTRLPPGYSARTQTQRPTNVHAAHYSKGISSSL